MFAAQKVMTVEVERTESQEHVGHVLAHLHISSESPLLSHSKSTQNEILFLRHSLDPFPITIFISDLYFSVLQSRHSGAAGRLGKKGV